MIPHPTLYKLPAKSHALLFFSQQGGRETDRLFNLCGCAAANLEEAFGAFVASQRADFQTCVAKVGLFPTFAFGLCGVHRQATDTSLFIENIS